jgi:chromosome segregation ATPase
MNTAYSIEGSEHQEVREWRMQQTKEDKNSLPYVKKYLHRLQHKITELGQELSNAEQNWENAASKVDSIEDALREIVAITGDDHLLT